MPRELDVYLHDRLVGRLVQNNHGELSFTYSDQWLSDLRRYPISQSLPLEARAFTSRECRPFFGGLLPEEGQRDVVAKNVGVSAKNDFALLWEIGGECAGAVSLWPEGSAPTGTTPSHEVLSDAQLAELIRQLPQRPLLTGSHGIRISLAGAQSKLALHWQDGRFAIPQGNALSTHILKPDSKSLPGLVFNEAFVMELARQVGIPAARSELLTVEDLTILVVERYDRVKRATEQGEKIERLHQEDFCQALGIVSEFKYQSEGGPSLKSCFDLVRRASASPVIDLARLLDLVLFNFLVGNNDAHGKNFSLLYQADGNVRLAPAYDLLTTRLYPDLDSKMAMKIGSKNDPNRVQQNHLEEMAAEASLAKAATVRRVIDIGELVLRRIHNAEQALGRQEASAVAADIETRVEATLRRLKD